MRHYVNGRLIALECDHCGALITPHPRISESGWVKCGIDDPKQGGRMEWEYCPKHASIAEQFEDPAHRRGAWS